MPPPSPAAPATPAPAQGAAPAKPAAGAPASPQAPAGKPAEPPKPAAGAEPQAGAQALQPRNPVEADLMKEYGEDWGKMTQGVRDRVLAGEMKAREADKRMQLAARLKKDLDMTNAQVAQLIENLKKDPWGVIS